MEKAGVGLTCPIPTHIDEGNLREKSPSQFRGTLLILLNDIVKSGSVKCDCWLPSQIKSCVTGL